MLVHSQLMPQLKMLTIRAYALIAVSLSEKTGKIVEKPDMSNIPFIPG